MLLFEKKLKNFEEISMILLTILIVFKKNLEVLDNFNKKYNTMHAFHWFFKETLYINCVYNRIFPKNGGGGMAPLAPPVADPMIVIYGIRTCTQSVHNKFPRRLSMG